MEVKIKNYQRQSNEQYDLARTLLKSGNKPGAQQALKRRELYLSSATSTHSKIANLQRTIDTLDISADNVTLTETLASAQTAIDANVEAASPERTEEVMMALEDSIETVAGLIPKPRRFSLYFSINCNEMSDNNGFPFRNLLKCFNTPISLLIVFGDLFIFK